MKYQLGRFVFGTGAVAFGLITLIWHQVKSLGNISHPAILVYTLGILELAAGLSLFLKKTIQYGALIISLVFLIFTFYWLPQIVSTPLVFGNWGNALEEFSVFLGAVFIFTSTIHNHAGMTNKIDRISYLCYGLCVLSYGLYQLFYLKYTANLVPKWIPPGQMFWAVVTSIAFILAAFAFLSELMALPASRLLVIMLIGFGLLIWVPACIIHPHVMSNWVENASNLAMTGSAWIVTDKIYLSGVQPINRT